MKKLTKTLVLLILSLTVSTSVFAQSSASANVPVKAQLTKGLAISHESGNLDFSEIILTAGAAATPSIDPDNGAQVLVTGQPNKTVRVSFSSVTLNNNSWVTLNGGTNDNLVFTPSVHETSSSSSYQGANAYSSNSDITLDNVSGDGMLYFWVGGSLDIASDQQHGDYTGTFTMTVEY